jgi:ABC-type transport system involved in multi-copper enzyme maturation permease subunit
MLDLLRSEWMKATRNIPLISFLIWILPVGIAASFTIFIVFGFFSEAMHTALDEFSTGRWTTDMTVVWTFVISFPANIFGRMAPLAFIVTGFAGEYQWDTWKNIIPRSRRTSLILSKLIVLIAIVMLSLLISSLILGMMQIAGHAVRGAPYGPSLSAEVIGDFSLSYTQMALIALISVAILGGSGALAAILTRSILGGLLASFFFSVLDAMSMGGLIFLGSLFNKPDLINLYLYTPSYNLDNLRSWFETGSAYVPTPTFTASPGVAISLAILLVWIVSLVGASILIFRKQDIT